MRGKGVRMRLREMLFKFIDQKLVLGGFVDQLSKACGCCDVVESVLEGSLLREKQ